MGDFFGGDVEKGIGSFEPLRGIVSPAFIDFSQSYCELRDYIEVGFSFSAFFEYVASESDYLRQIGEENADLLIGLELLSSVFDLILPALFKSNGRNSDGTSLEANSRSAVSLSLFIRQVLDTFRRCVWGGDDISASILARTLSEAFDVLFLVSFDRSASDDYIGSSDNPEKFYYKHIARGSLSRRRTELLDSFFGATVAREVEEYASAEFRAFSQAVHPSYTAGVMLMLSAFPKEKNDPWAFMDDWPCKRVVRFVLYSMSLSLALVATRNIAKPTENNSQIESMWATIHGAANVGLWVTTKGTRSEGA